MTVVITSWRSNRYLSGTRICDSSGRADSWGCDTIDRSPFIACSWFGSSGPAYITEGCYNGLTDAEKAACPGRYHGIVTRSGYYYVYDTAYYNHYKLKIESIVECWSAACNTLLCSDVVCEPLCYNHDLHETECISGVCEQAALIEEDSYDCGYTDPTILDTLIDNSALVIIGLFAGALVIGAVMPTE